MTKENSLVVSVFFSKRNVENKIINRKWITYYRVCMSKCRYLCRYVLVRLYIYTSVDVYKVPVRVCVCSWSYLISIINPNYSPQASLIYNQWRERPVFNGSLHFNEEIVHTCIQAYVCVYVTPSIRLSVCLSVFRSPKPKGIIK